MIAKVSEPKSSPPSEPARSRRATGEHPVGSTGEGVVPQEQEVASFEAKKSRRGVWLLWLIMIALAVPAWFYREQWWTPIAPYFSTKVAPTKAAPRVTPVATAVVKKRDLELYLNGLGTVTALKTVTIRSRVEGELVNVAFNEGQIVQEGDLLAEIDRRPFEVQRDQANGQLARDEAILKGAQLNLTRLQRLAQSNAASAQEVDNQVAVVQQTEGAIKADKAMVANAELQLTYCHIVSPITGRIGLRLVDVGNIVRANDPNGLAVITQLQPIAIIFTISQDDIPRVQNRFRAGHTLRVDAFDRDFTTKLASGKLLATDNQVDPTTGTLRLKAIFDEENTRLFPNQFVNTRLLVDVKKDATVVPSAAVQRGPNATFVYVVKSDETVELRNVEVGPSEGSETSIEAGVQPGEIVVTDGIDKLQPGAKVSTRDSSDKGSSSAEPNAEAKQPSEPKAPEEHADRSKAAR
jgi:multidrug efflux system membrane fusion protein